jgi:hypothetical protein
MHLGGYDCDLPAGSKHEYGKGSRIITFSDGSVGGGSSTITTHVRMANGSVIHQGTLA